MTGIHSQCIMKLPKFLLNEQEQQIWQCNPDNTQAKEPLLQEQIFITCLSL